MLAHQNTTRSNLVKVALLALSLVVGEASRALTLNEYMEAVKGSSPTYKATAESVEGARLLSREAELVFSPQFYAEAQKGHDGKETMPRTSDRIDSQSYSMGISQQFNFGLKGKLSFGVSELNFVNANALFIPTPNYWDATPKLELSMPLWGGGFGSTARANEELIRQQSVATQYSSEAQKLLVLAQAEGAYWKLSAWTDVVRIQEEAMTAANNIMSYVSKKEKMNLGEGADIVQAQALVEARTLELQVARNEQKEALRNANRFLHRGPEEAITGLQAVDYAALENMANPAARPGDRPDVLGVNAQLKTASAAAILATERNRPTLEAFGTYALNGRNEDMNEALKNAGYTKTDTSYIGLRLNVPLNMGALSDAKAGAQRNLKAAEYNQESARFSQEQDWVDLTTNLTNLRDNLKLLSRIENAQKAKLNAERSRLRQGRTTTYQVLLFEQDYSQAALGRVKLGANLLALKTQIQFYGAGSAGVQGAAATPLTPAPNDQGKGN